MLSIDEIDHQLLAEVQKNAAVTQRTLAEQLGISPATVLRRLERLKSEGFIEREVAILSPARLGPFLQVVAEVTLDKQDSASLDAFENLLQPADAVQQCYRVSAGPDFILIITVPDMDAYQALAQEIFSAQHNVRNVRAFFSTKRAKFTTLLPLSQKTAE